MAVKTYKKPAIQKQAQPHWIALVIVYLLFPILLFACGGDIAWWQAWIFSLLIVAAGVLGRILAERRHPGMQVEREQGLLNKQSNVKRRDKVLSPLMSVSVSFPLIIVAGLDHRFEWSSRFPIWLTLLGLALVGIGYAFAAWALVENRFFSGVVRIQTDRGHVVCDSGPYRIMRHPGYAGNALALPAIALALNSVWTFIPAAAALVIVVTRTALEDRTLQEELPGYQEYMRRVHYRLFPGLW